MHNEDLTKLMNGQLAKWAKMEDMPNPFSLTEDEKVVVKETITENEEPIPDGVMKDVWLFVERERQKGVKERTIRRAVKRHWNIKSF